MKSWNHYCLFFLATLLFLSCGWNEPELAENSPPVINDVLVDGDSIEAPTIREEQQVVLMAVVWDPNGDTLVPEGFKWEADEGTFESEGGSTAVWRAPTVSWEVPPQEVLIDIKVTVSDGRGGEDEKTITITVAPPCSPDNLPPVITEMTAEPDSIGLGDSSTINVEAEDPEGDTLTYEWIIPFGTYEGQRSEITWLATETCCRDWYPIQVFVSDGCKTSWAKVEVEVIP